MLKNCFDMFSKLSAAITETSSILKTYLLRDKIIEHLTVLLEHFEIYFPSEDNGS